MHVTAWKAIADKGGIDTDTPRKIFLHKKTITYLQGKSKEA